MHLDHYNYHRYTGPAKLEKSINLLMSVCAGIVLWI